MHKILFHVGPVTVYSYGLFVALGFLLGTVLVMRVSEKYGFSKDDVFDCLMWVLIGGLIGGRFLFVLINFSYFLNEPVRIFFLNQGGLAVQGAILTGIISCALVCRFKKLSFLKVLDLISPYLALGQAVGRIGCFFNGCCYGRIITDGYGVIFPGQCFSRIPTQLYSSFGLVIIFLLLIFLRDKKRFNGFIFSMYMFLYSLFRFFIDFLRGDDLLAFNHITLSQYISAGMFGFSIVLLLIFYSNNRKQKNGD